MNNQISVAPEWHPFPLTAIKSCPRHASLKHIQVPYSHILPTILPNGRRRDTLIFAEAGYQVGGQFHAMARLTRAKPGGEWILLLADNAFDVERRLGVNWTPCMDLAIAVYESMLREARAPHRSAQKGCRN